MSSISAGKTAVADTRTAGGKITRNRRLPPSSRTPYARPPPSAEDEEEEYEESENPNWLSNLIYPAKVIASGAGKILSLFGHESSSSSEDDSENDDDDADAENSGSDKLKVSLPSSKSASKRKIEQLVMEETFSREEATELIKLIKSRLMDTNGISGECTPRGRSTPVMEARKWLQEKRSGKKKLETELNLSPSQFARNEKGSPVDMAKSYMQNRPAWASPSLKQVDFNSLSALGRSHAKEETPNSTFCSSELKRNSLASGSWNLLDEIRRVRTKATEELLAATPLEKSTLSLFSSDNGPSEDILETKGVEEGAGRTELKHITLESVFPDAAADGVSRINQDGEAVQTMEHHVQLEAADLKSKKYNQVNELSIAAENGFVRSSSDLMQGQDVTNKDGSPGKRNGNIVGSSQGGQDLHIKTSNLLPETVDVPSTNPAESGFDVSQNNDSMQEDLSQEINHSIADVPSPTAKAKAKDAPEGRKTRGSTRRGRGRGK